MPTKRSQYEATSRSRAMLRAQAQLNGWEVLDVLGAYLTPEGEVIVLTKDGRRYGVTIPFSPADPVGDSVTSLASVKTPTKTKRVYAPKSWDGAKWNDVVARLKAQSYTKEDARAEIGTAKTLNAKQRAHAVAVIDAVPDAPDWYDYLPLA